MEKTLKIKTLIMFILMSASSFLNAQTIFSRGNGDWDIPGQWSTVAVGGPSCGCTPGPVDDVVIDGNNIDIDAGTGNVTVNSLIMTNSSSSNTVDLRINGGSILTVTNNFELELDISNDDALLFVDGAGSGLNVGGDFIVDQNGGDDINFDIDNSAVVNVAGNFNVFQDGGDDIRLYLNSNGGTVAQLNIIGDFIVDHDGGDDMIILIDDASSLIDIDGNMAVRLNTGNDDDFTFNIDNGDLNIAGGLELTRALNTAQIDFDMDGGVVTVGGVLDVNCSGTLFVDSAIRFYIDGDAEVNSNSCTVDFTGGDDFYIRINTNAGTSGEFNVTNNMTITRTSGDDVHIHLDEDNSEMTVGGNFTLVHSGTATEEFEIKLDNNATFDVGGNMTLTILDGENSEGNEHIIQLQGGNDNPVFHVGGNFTWTSSINLVDCDIDVNGGTFDIDGNFTILQSPGADDFDIELDEDGIVTIGGNMSMTLNGGDDMSLSLGLRDAATTATWTVAGNCSLIHNNNIGGSNFEHFVYADSRLTILGSLTLTKNFTAPVTFLQDLRNTAEISVGGNVNLNAVASGELEIRPQNTTFFRIGGNFIRAAAPNNFGELDCSSGTPTVEYMGTIAQIIAEDAGGGGDSFYYHNLEIDNSFGTIPMLTMEGLATVHGDLTMNDGIVASDATDILVVDDNATTSNASDDSYVDGYTRKIGNEPYTFPIGDGGFYGPLAIAAPALTTDQFEAQHIYNAADDDGFDSTMHDISVNYISKVEYWRFNRTAGTSTPTVTLTWDTPRSGGVGNITALRFMRWNGSTWNDLGQTAVTGNTVAGTLDHLTAIGSYADGNPFTLGTTDPINPLPIDLLYFDAQLANNVVNLTWLTKSEIDNDYFTVEKSKDGQSWEFVSKQSGAGNSSVDIYYDSEDEKPYLGLLYYRLKQTDFNGLYEYSDIVPVNRELDLSLYPNPSNGDVFISGNIDDTQVQIYNALGQIIPMEFYEENGVLRFSTTSMVNGTYLIRFSNEAINGVKHLIVQH